MIGNVREAHHARVLAMEKREYLAAKSDKALRQVVVRYEAHHGKSFFERVKARWNGDSVPCETHYRWVLTEILERGNFRDIDK